MRMFKAARRAVLLPFLAFVIGGQAHALVPGIGWGYTLGYSTAHVVLSSSVWDFSNAWIGWWDPPADVLSGQLTFAYDPSLIVIHPENSGFIGAFSDDPSVNLPYNSSEVYPTFDTSTFPNPRPGMLWNLNVGVDTVTLNFDLTANPLTLTNPTENINFFGLVMETKKPVSSWTLNTTSTGQFRELGSPSDQTQTYMNCKDSSGATYGCGSTQFLGMTANYVPEPGSLILFLPGLAAFGFSVKRRKRSA